MALSPEELLAQLKTRGFEEGFQKSPLREFTGKLDSITSEEVEQNGRKWINALYNFSELNVIASTEPYNFPIAQVSLGVSNRSQSAMGVFGNSVDKIINAGVPKDAPPEMLKGQGWLIGHNLHLKMTGGHMQWDRDKKMETPRENWELIGVDGTAPSAPQAAGGSAAPATATKGSVATALDLLNGKTEQEWYQAVFANPIVKGDGALVSRIIQHTFLPELEGSGVVVKGADGKYSVKM